MLGFLNGARLESKVRGRLRVFRGKIFTIFGAVGRLSGGLWELVGAFGKRSSRYSALVGRFRELDGAFGRILDQLGWTSLGSFSPKGS